MYARAHEVPRSLVHSGCSVTISGHSHEVNADGEQAECHSPAGEERHFLASLCCLSLSCDIADTCMYVSGLLQKG